jgi:sugar lactone lactonase YvrE
MGGTAGQGPSGTIRVLSADATRLNTPTTAAIRGNNLWVANGQLPGLFGGAAPVIPFNVVSVPLAGGDVGDTDIVLPGSDFYPEGVAAAPDGTLYVGSINLGSIVRVAATSTTPDATPFVAATVSQRAVVGLTVDQDRGLLWFCDSGPGALGGALVGVDLDDGTETVRHEMPDPVAPVADAGTPDGDAGTDAGDAGDAATPPPPAAPSTFCNDVIVDEDDVIFITDSSGRIFRIAANLATTANSATVWLEHPAIAPPMPGGFGANGIDVLGDQLIISNGDTGNLMAVNRNSNNPASTVRVLELTEGGAATTLCGPDGLQAVPGTSDIVVVENGFCATPRERVIRITLDLD